MVNKDEKKIKVGILKNEADKQDKFSLSKNTEIVSYILENLSDKYSVVEILVDKNSNWNIEGISIIPSDLVYKVDVIWNISQRFDLSMVLNNLFIPNIGGGFFLRILENNNDILKNILKILE